MIIGKGHEDGATYLGPDMDSSYGRGQWVSVDFRGASYLPEPATLLLAVAGIGMLRRRH